MLGGKSICKKKKEKYLSMKRNSPQKGEWKEEFVKYNQDQVFKLLVITTHNGILDLPVVDATKSPAVLSVKLNTRRSPG